MDDATETATSAVCSVQHATSSAIRPARTPAPLRVRDRDRYDIRGEQGRGGLGLVLRAHDRELGRDVAVKELLNRGNASELRFFREALITSRLEHPGIVPVHEAGRWSDGTPFYTMKLVGGRSLHALLAEQATLEARLQYLTNVIAVADAIAYAHDRGVIHRDLKPSNVMVGEFGETIVIDWGLAKVLDETADPHEEDAPYRSPARNEVTAVGSVLGTPAYMAPEQYAGRVDHRADIYALGGILHHVLTGRPPHERRSPSAAFEPEFQYLRKTPADLIAIVKRACAHDPAHRYATARAFAEDLKRYIRHDRIAARRYSLAARLTLAFARHRTVSFVLVAALVALSVIFSVALFNIRKERAQAIAAREAAIVNSAAAMLGRDPTRAWNILQSVPPQVAPPLLRARIQAAGVAERRISLPGRFYTKEVMEDGTHVVLSTTERTLHVLDTLTGTLTKLADGLTEPAIWAATEDGVYFVRDNTHISLAFVSLAGGEPEELAALPQKPILMAASKVGAFWLSSEGTLNQATRTRATGEVARDVTDFVLVGSTLVICDKEQKLRMGPPGEGLMVIGVCSPEGVWATSARGFAYFNGGTDYTYYAGKLRIRTVSKADALAFGALTDTGLVAGIGRAGEALVLKPDGDVVERRQLSNRPEFVSAYGNIAGWAFSDGRIELFDTVDGRYWTMHAFQGMPRCFVLLGADRLMTCDRLEVRLWRLPHTAPRVVTTFGSGPNNVVLDEDGNALFDGDTGQANVIRQGVGEGIAIHAHSSLSFGAAWCDAQACTSGWDGRVMCTDLSTGTSRIAADFSSVTPWIAQGGGHCFTAAASGGVYDLRDTSRPIYEHRHEPYRIAVTPNERYVASGDWGGDLVVYDALRGRVAATVDRAHAGRVTGVAWMDGMLVSSGSDGVLQLWAPSLERQRTWRFGSSIRYLGTAGGMIYVAVEDGTLWMVSVRTALQHQLATGLVFTALAVSPNGAFVAVGTNDGDVIVVSADERAAATRFGDGHIPCLVFESNTSLVVCTRSGNVMRVPLDALPFSQSKEYI